jgi:integrative and conjugative element protein (TIGR02256 family)
MKMVRHFQKKFLVLQQSLQAGQHQKQDNMSQNISLDGILVSPDKLSIQKAFECAFAAQKMPFVSFVECRILENGDEIIILDLEIELAQKRIADIRSIERVCIQFDKNDNITPEVLSLREDFPIVPHLNLRLKEIPRSLCLYEEPYSERKLYWTAVSFIERIREWFSFTAKGLLHKDDQPLEPLLIGSEGDLILPPDIINKENNTRLLFVNYVGEINNRLALIAQYHDISKFKNAPRFAAIALEVSPHIHGIIRHSPKNIFELHTILLSVGYDLLKELRNRLLEYDSSSDRKQILSSSFILILILPKKRSAEMEPEKVEIRAFLSFRSLVEIGTDLGIWILHSESKVKEIGRLMPFDETKHGENIEIGMLNPISSFNRNLAASLNNHSPSDTRIAIIGAGAIGSQLITNLVRMGQHKWTIIDKDSFLPHNASRHALPAGYVGMSKADALKLFLDQFSQEEDSISAIVSDILDPTFLPDNFAKAKIAISESSAIIDASASIATLRELIHGFKIQAPIVSCFLNPSGEDLVFISEDKNKEYRLDILEMQYFRALLNYNELANHLVSQNDQIRYAGSCGDVSNITRQSSFSIFSGICSEEFIGYMSNPVSKISIWRLDPITRSVKRIDIAVSKPIIIKNNNWTVHLDVHLIDKLQQIRTSKLPNETGGILIGSYDMQRKLVYLVDTIPSPPDSMEWPTVYIRGSVGLKKSLDEVNKRTSGRLEYVGEWHSHPSDSSSTASNTDHQAFLWLTQVMADFGLPSLMVILSDTHDFSLYVGSIS